MRDGVAVPSRLGAGVTGPSSEPESEVTATSDRGKLEYMAGMRAELLKVESLSVQWRICTCDWRRVYIIIEGVLLLGDKVRGYAVCANRMYWRVGAPESCYSEE